MIQYGKMLLYIIIVAILIYFLEWYGVWGVLIFILTISFYKMWKSRQILINMMQQMEAMIFGKPLDKDGWSKDEMKHTKIELYWGKGNLVDWSKYITIVFYPALICLTIGYGFKKALMINTGYSLLVLLLIVKSIGWVKTKCT